MNNATRVLPYVWPHRRLLFLSVFFASLVAAFWGLNLSMSFLVVKVFLEGQKIADYIDDEIETAKAEGEEATSTVEYIDEQLQKAEKGLPVEGGVDHMKLLKRRSRKQSDLKSASRKLLVLTWIKTRVVPWLPGDQFDMFALILAVLLATTALKGVCLFVQEVLIGKVVELTTMDIRKDSFRRTLNLDYQTLSLCGTSTLMSHFTYDMNVLSNGLRILGGKVVREPLKAAACLIVAFFVSWQLTLLSMLFVPLAAYVLYRIGRKLKLATQRMMESMTKIYKTLEETFESMKVVIAFNGFPRHRQRFHRENKEYYRKALKIVKVDALTSPSTELLGILAAFIALLPGAYLVLRDTRTIWGITLVSAPLEIAELSMMYALLAGMIDPARKLSSTYAKIKRATAAADRIFAQMDRKPLVTEMAAPKPAARHSKTIAFHKVSFSYAAGDGASAVRPSVLEDINLKVAAGEVVVVVGENGSGKSTLVNLLPRYFDPDHGSVRVDGVDIREWRLRDLRSQIGVVTQETLLFDDTIYENIRYGRPAASRNEIERAARHAHVMPFVDQLPGGFETRVGPKGGRLSGGQRQRIALARAILRDPAILILDEATSAIDSQSKLLIHQTLRTFVQGRTTFIITHSVSPSILDFVSRIVVMDQGRLIAVGTHEQLIETCPVYQRLFHAQLQHGADDEEESDARVGGPVEAAIPGGSDDGQESDLDLRQSA